ncbi:MAG: exosome complex RNA-binding protein Csl4 [Methanobacteriaceae archaeon]|nr:exosome complex RNA-binding protein Csl4 [Methanobacteriaceae archaeon]
MLFKKGDVVAPGDIICTCEEYIPLDNVYEDNNGYIISEIQGHVSIDNSEKTVSIEANTPKLLEKDDIVIGYITEIKPHKIFITVKKIKDTDTLPVAYKGYIHISNTVNDFVPSINDLFKIGDIVEAKVIKMISKEFINLSTVDEDLGIIKAICPNCRQFMDINNNTKELYCSCGNKDKRKISSNYGGY